MFEYTDDFVAGSVEPNFLTQRVGVGEKRFGDSGAKDYDLAGVLFVKRADEPPAVNRK